jgi:putative thioredoxin
VFQGQLIPGFVGALPEAQCRQFLAQVAALPGRVAADVDGAGDGAGEAAGEVAEDGAEAGTASDGMAADALRSDGAAGVGTAGEAVPVEPPMDPLEEAALDALDAGDLVGAADAFRQLVESQPGNAEARIGLARVELLRRTMGTDPHDVLAAASAAPDDIAAQTLAADVEVAQGLVEHAVSRLVDLVRRTEGADRDVARTHLIGLFELLGDDDPRVAKGRTALANALF